MRAAAAVLVVAFSAACTEPDVPKYDLNPGAPTIQIPTTIRLSVLQGIGADAQHAYVTASLRDQAGRGIADTLLTFSTSKGTIEPAIAKTTVDGNAKATVTHGADLTISVSGAGLTASMDVSIAASLSVSLSASRAEKNVPVTLTANVNSDASPPLRFVWNFGDGQTAATDVATVTHTWADDGPFKTEVSVTDAIDRRGTASLSIVVRDNPEPPPPPTQPAPPTPSLDVGLSVTPLQPIAGELATLTAVVTPHNSPPPVTSFDWDCTNDGTIDGTTAGTTFQCTYATAGAVTAKATAHAGTVTGVGVLGITVGMAPTPSIDVGLSVSPSPPLAGQAATLTAVVTPHNSPPPVTSFDWDCTSDGAIDGTTAGNTFQCTYASAGAVTAKAVAHAGTVTGTGTLAITVGTAPPPSVAVTLTATPNAGQVNVTTIALTASATAQNGAGPVLSYDWDFDGNGTYETTTTTTFTTHIYTAVGTFTTKVRANSTTPGLSGIGSAVVAITN